MSKNQLETMDDLLSEFEFTVDEAQEPNPADVITIDMGTEEEIAAAAELEAAELEAAEEIAAEEAELEVAAEKAKQGNNSGYKEIALKYIEKGTWGADLAVEDAEGNVVPVSELDVIDEETFFQIEEAVKAQNEEANKDKFISVEGVDERRKNIIDIVKAGGDLTEIFTNKDDVEDYINPFSKLDLDNENVQERLYLNALVKHNKLDAETAQTVVDKAKEDLTLDTKVKAYIEQYTTSFDKYVEGKKTEVIETKKEEAKAQREFKKALKAQYKEFNIKDTLASKLADSAVTKKDGEFEIDSIYAKAMESPEEAAELVLFLTDKKAYLDFKMKDKSLEQHKKTRQVIKLIPREKVPTKKEGDEDLAENSEFDFVVPVNKK